MYRPSQAVAAAFVTTQQYGVVHDADSAPTGRAFRNGVLDAAMPVTVTSIGSGVYFAAATIPAGYAARDQFTIIVDYSISGAGPPYPIAVSVAVLEGEISDAPTLTQISAALLANPSAPLANTSTGDIDIDLAESTGDTALLGVGTVGEALAAARAQGFGKWAINGTVFTLYASDGTTVLHTFTLNSATAPTTRT